MAKSATSGQGRPKGVPNKLTGQVKDMILGALADAGGQQYLARQADENPVAFMSLLGRIVPVEQKQIGDDGKAVDNKPSILWVVQK